MKTTIILALLALLGLNLGAAPAPQIDKVQFQDGKVLVWPGGTPLMAPNEASLPYAIVVRTNGTFTVAGGKERSLTSGDVLDASGMLTKADGTVAPVMNHAAYKRGRLFITKDGVASDADRLVTLTDGSTLEADGKYTPRTGSPRRLLDGEMFLLDGTPIQTRDTITLRDGRVQVQKDGSVMTVAAGASIMMNDGTKVFGDGRVVNSNGQETRLAEGQIIVVSGVATRAR